jgi:hypothetical protein
MWNLLSFPNYLCSTSLPQSCINKVKERIKNLCVKYTKKHDSVTPTNSKIKQTIETSSARAHVMDFTAFKAAIKD